MNYQQYSTEQLHAIISKYKLENNISGLIEIAHAVPKMAKPIEDMVKSYIDKTEKAQNRLKELEVEL